MLCGCALIPRTIARNPSVYAGSGCIGSALGPSNWKQVRTDRHPRVDFETARLYLYLTPLPIFPLKTPMTPRGSPYAQKGVSAHSHIYFFSR